MRVPLVREVVARHSRWRRPGQQEIVGKPCRVKPKGSLQHTRTAVAGPLVAPWAAFKPRRRPPRAPWHQSNASPAPMEDSSRAAARPDTGSSAAAGTSGSHARPRCRRRCSLPSLCRLRLGLTRSVSTDASATVPRFEPDCRDPLPTEVMVSTLDSAPSSVPEYAVPAPWRDERGGEPGSRLGRRPGDSSDARLPLRPPSRPCRSASGAPALPAVRRVASCRRLASSEAPLEARALMACSACARADRRAGLTGGAAPWRPPGAAARAGSRRSSGVARPAKGEADGEASSKDERAFEPAHGVTGLTENATDAGDASSAPRSAWALPETGGVACLPRLEASPPAADGGAGRSGVPPAPRSPLRWGGACPPSRSRRSPSICDRNALTASAARSRARCTPRRRCGGDEAEPSAARPGEASPTRAWAAAARLTRASAAATAVRAASAVLSSRGAPSCATLASRSRRRATSAEALARLCRVKTGAEAALGALAAGTAAGEGCATTGEAMPPRRLEGPLSTG